MVNYTGNKWEYKAYINRIDINTIYILHDVTENGIVRLKPEGEEYNNSTSLNIEQDKLKFIIDNNLIHVKGFKVTAAGKVALVSNYENTIDIVEVNRLQRLISDDEKAQELRLKQERSLQEQQEQGKQPGKIRQFFNGFLDMMDSFSQPSSSKSNNISERDKAIQRANNIPNLGARQFNKGLVNMLSSDKK